jgi:hypothetical protein
VEGKWRVVVNVKEWCSTICIKIKYNTVQPICVGYDVWEVKWIFVDCVYYINASCANDKRNIENPIKLTNSCVIFFMLV